MVGSRRLKSENQELEAIKREMSEYQEERLKLERKLKNSEAKLEKGIRGIKDVSPDNEPGKWKL